MKAASNVILAKARAMYGRRIRPEQMEALLSCRSLPEVCGYLKQSTAYADVLRDTDESRIHRGHLEHLLRRKQVEELMALCRYENTVGQALATYWEHRIQTEWLVQYLRLLARGAAADFYWKFPPFFAARSGLDLGALSQVTRYEELPAVLQDTPYGEILQKVPAEKGQVPLAAAEHALHYRLRLEMQAIIDHTHGEEQVQLRRLCGGMDDTENVVRLYRLRRWFPDDMGDLSQVLLPAGGCLTPRETRRLREEPDAEKLRLAFLQTRLARHIPAAAADDVGEWLLWESFYTACHEIHFSVYPSVVLVAYSILMDVERSNLTRLIEGVRYGMPASQIRSLLILPKEAI